MAFSKGAGEVGEAILRGASRTLDEVLLDMVAAMGGFVEDEALSEAYGELYQALAALFLQEDEGRVADDARAYIANGPSSKAAAVREALRRLGEVSPADGEAIREAVRRVMAHIAFTGRGGGE